MELSTRYFITKTDVEKRLLRSILTNSPEKRAGGYERKMNKERLFTTWEDHEKELLRKGSISEEEIRESELRVALMSEIIMARKEQNITQQQLEKLSGVRQPVIARMENMTSIPKIDTVMKVLAPLGKTLAVVPIDRR